MANNRRNAKVNNARYAYSANTAYDLSGFDVARPEPKYEPQKENRYKPKFEIVDKPVLQTDSQKRASEKHANRRVAKTLVVAVLFFGLFGAMLYGETKKNELTKEISAASTQYDVAKSENARLNLILSSTFSMDKIEQYATENLGMVKMQNYQVNYVNLAEKQKEIEALQAEKESLAQQEQLEQEKLKQLEQESVAGQGDGTNVQPGQEQETAANESTAAPASGTASSDAPSDETVVLE